MVVSKFGHAFLGIASGLAGLISLPYVLMAFHDVSDGFSGDWHDNPKWAVLAGFGFSASLSFGAFYMASRFLRYAFATKSLGSKD